MSEEVYHLSDTESYSVTFSYDAFGRLESTTSPDNQTTTYSYDLLGRRIGVTDSSGTTQFEYDLWDNLVALIDAENQRTEFEYYADGRLKKEIRPMLQETTYEYDSFDRLWKVTDAKNQTTEYGYDVQSRIETIVYADGKTVTLTYDNDGNLSGYSDGETSASYTVDAMGRKLTETVNYGPFSKSFSYSYYDNGLKHTFTAPDSTVYTYLYGLNNELQEVQIPSVGSITIPAYTWNRPATINYPGGTQRAYTYDALMRIQSLNVVDPTLNSLLNYQYTYNSVGNILTKTTEHGNSTYGYDAVSRLLTADNPVLDDETYTYDDVGNRLTSADVSGTWNYNPNNELLGYADVEYDYDANGNLAEVRVAGQMVWTCVYDAANRLVHVEDGTGTISADYYYDPFGRRLWKDVGGTKTYFFYSEEGLIAEYDATGMEIKSYGYKPDSTWTTDPLFQKVGSTYYWYQNDHLGTPQKLVAQNGTVVWSAQYQAFGEADVQVEAVVNNLRFPGQYADAETGLHYNWFRYYDPKSGRYVGADPIGLLGGDANLYTYIWNDPNNDLDPYGLSDLLTPTAKQIAKQRIKQKIMQRAIQETVRSIKGIGRKMLGGAVGIAMIFAEILLFPDPVGITPDGVLEEDEFDLSPGVSPYSQPAPFPNPVPQGTGEGCCEDEAGESCSCRELGPIILYAVRPGQAPGVDIGHAFVAWRSSWETGVQAWGWTFVGEANSVTDPRDGMALPNQQFILAAEPLRVYQACPETMNKLKRSIFLDNIDGTYQVQNINGKNCFGWAFQVIQEAKLSPPRSPDMKFEPSAPVPRDSRYEQAKEEFFTQIGQFINQLITDIQRGIP